MWIQTPLEPTVWISESDKGQAPPLAEIDQVGGRTGLDPTPLAPYLRSRGDFATGR
jgi:hypothetical protein